MSLVPKTAEEVESSKEFELKHTTSNGVKIYIRELTKEQADSILVGSEEDEFLSYQENPQRLMVTIKENKIVSGEMDDLNDNIEIMDFMVENGL